MTDVFVASKITKYIVAPHEVRYKPITPEATRNAWIEDAVEDLGRFDADVLSGAFTMVRRGHRKDQKRNNWTPEICDYLSAAQRIQTERTTHQGGTGEGNLGAINAAAAKYAGEFPWKDRQGIRIHEAGVPAKEIRDYVKPIAVKQLGQGWAEPDVRIPEDVVDAMVAKWRGTLGRDTARRNPQPVRKMIAGAVKRPPKPENHTNGLWTDSGWAGHSEPKAAGVA